MTKFARPFFAASAAALVVACGGGGGGSATPPPVSKPAPTVAVSISALKTSVSVPVTVTWSSTNASSCVGLDGLNGARELSGSENLTLSAGGQYKYTISCVGDGGTSKQSVDLVVPMPVMATSYENAKLITLADPNFPSPDQLPGVPLTFFQGGSAAYADFFQEGSFSVAIQLTQWKTSDTSKAANAPSRLFFFRKGTDGKWIDATSQLISNNTGCISPRKAVVADFNNDKRPDIFYACHGYDGAPTDPGRPPFGDNQQLILSQSDGTYANLKLPFVGYGHGASAADLNGDGLPDVIVTNTSGKDPDPNGYGNPLAATEGVPYVLMNKGGGAFELDLTRFPKEKDGGPTTLGYFGIYGLELIDTKGNGKPDLFIGGVPESYATYCPRCSPNGMLTNDGNGYFDKAPMRFFPVVMHSSGKYYGGALDYVYSKGFIYFQHEVVGLTPTEWVVRKISLTDFSMTTAFSRVGPWPTWLKPDGKGNITAHEANCAYPVTSESVCGVTFKD